MTSNNTAANMLRSHAESLRSGRGVLSSMSTDERLDRAADEIEHLEAERDRLREALEIIAGHKQCIDNTLGNEEIARIALKESEG